METAYNMHQPYTIKHILYGIIGHIGYIAHSAIAAGATCYLETSRIMRTYGSCTCVAWLNVAYGYGRLGASKFGFSAFGIRQVAERQRGFCIEWRYILSPCFNKSLSYYSLPLAAAASISRTPADCLVAFIIS